MQPPARGFALSEYEQRTLRAQRLMTEWKLDVLLLTTKPNVLYFTGFMTQFWESPTRPWFVLVPREGRPIAVIPEIGAKGMAKTWVEDVRAWPSPRPEDDGVSLLSATLSECATRFGRIGATLGPGSHLRMPEADFQKVVSAVRPHEIIDATELVHYLRSVKSEAEIEKIAYVCDITSAAFEALPDAMAIGHTEREITQVFRRDLIARGADDSPYLIACSGLGGYDNIIMGPTDRALGSGDLLIIDTGTTFDGYFCDFDRNFAFGTPSDEARRAHAVVYRATEAGFAAAHPGAMTTDLWRAMNAVLEEGGTLGNDVGRLGHGLGLQLTEWPSNRPGDDTLLEASMIMTLEPGMEFAPGKMMVHEENIVITEGGARFLTRRAPTEMPVIS